MNAWNASDGHAVLTIDGSYGEGGGQILRTALSLAVALRRPVTITHIRARRPSPGLQPQHLTVVRSLAAISAAKVGGDSLGSTEVAFQPHTLTGGEYRFDVGASRGSAGSVALMCQALVLPLVFAPSRSRLVLIGGTHVPWSPPVHYLTDVFLPALHQVGVCVRIALIRWGWYPAGGGEIEVAVTPAGVIGGFVPAASTGDPRVQGLSAVSRLPRMIAERQRARAAERLAAAGIAADIRVHEDDTARGPGTLLFLALHGRAGFSALGRRGVPAERVADEAVDPLLHYLNTGAAIDAHLADQLLPFLALAGGESRFTCTNASLHLVTVAWVLRQFLPVRIEIAGEQPARVHVVPP